MIHLDHLTKSYGPVRAVDDLSLEIRPGELFGFLGPNGAGKTTTIKMMTGLTTATSGTILIGDYDIRKKPLEAKTLIGYVPDQPFLYDKLTGREFLFFSAGLYRVPHEAASSRIQHWLEILEIGAWIDRRTEEYSQGMRQRIVVAAALLHGPKVLIIDEPMVGLDPRGVSILKRVLREQTGSGTAVFMSTHSLPVVEELCTRIAIINKGRLVFQGSAREFEGLELRGNGKLEAAFLELTR